MFIVIKPAIGYPPISGLVKHGCPEQKPRSRIAIKENYNTFQGTFNCFFHFFDYISQKDGTAKRPATDFL